jgi:hypothetical protein
MNGHSQIAEQSQLLLAAAVWQAQHFGCFVCTQVVILGSPNDPELSKHTVSACVELLSWNNHVSNAASGAAL